MLKIFRRRFVQNIHLSTLLYKIAFNLWLNKKKQEQNSKHTLRKNKNKTPNTHQWKTRTKLRIHINEKQEQNSEYTSMKNKNKTPNTHKCGVRLHDYLQR